MAPSDTVLYTYCWNLLQHPAAISVKTTPHGGKSMASQSKGIHSLVSTLTRHLLNADLNI